MLISGSLRGPWSSSFELCSRTTFPYTWCASSTSKMDQINDFRDKIKFNFSGLWRWISTLGRPGGVLGGLKLEEIEDCELISEAPDGPKWFKMAPDGPKWLLDQVKRGKKTVGLRPPRGGPKIFEKNRKFCQNSDELGSGLGTSGDHFRTVLARFSKK